MASVNQAAATSARGSLAQWANLQDNWVRRLVSAILATSIMPVDDDISASYELLQLENGLKTGNYIQIEPLIAEAQQAEPHDTLTLKSLTIGSHVNALAQGQRLDFGPKLTVVFGENGSGKSGVVRILKRAAGVRSHEPVLPNVRIHDAGVPSATIEGEEGGRAVTCQWQNDIGVPPFTRLAVFDSRCIGLHVDSELAYIYVPGELELFQLTQAAIDRVRALLEADLRDKGPRQDRFVADFSPECSFFAAIQTLGPGSNLAQLRALAPDEADKAELRDLPNEVASLTTLDMAAQLALTELRSSVVAQARVIVDACLQFSVEDYHDTRNAVIEATSRHEEAAVTAFEGLNIPGVLSSEWKAFVEAGAEYIAKAGAPDGYPAQGHPCAYCRHPLNDDATELMRKYEAFVAGEARLQLHAAIRKIDGLTKDVRGLDVTSVLADLKRATASSDTGDLLFTIRPSLVTAEALRAAVAGFQPTVWTEKATELSSAQTVLAAEHTRLTAHLEGLRSKASERETLVSTKKSRLVELRDRSRLSELLADIEQHVEAARWAQRASAVNGRLTQVLKSLTEASKDASEVLLNRGFEQRFAEECGELRAPSVTLEFPGRQGQVARRKSIAGSYRPGQVLSEGEQKVLALADFLAEARGRATVGPVIFDDPITSLDHRRIKEIAQRIRALGESQQVIVFTHNIWFVLELLDLIEKGTCQLYMMWSDDGKVGLMSPSTNLRVDKIDGIKRKINERIQRASASNDYDERSEQIEKAYEYLRNICELIVEQDVLKGVTERYQPNVRMTVLSQINVAALAESAASIERVYSKACRYIASHSQPIETQSIRPTLDELRQDWQDVQTARAPHVGR